jgi:long-chain fatty acid transport protein
MIKPQLLVPRVFASALLFGTASATAGGMYLPTRGVRATARGGALIAGADDVSSLWQNPSGLAHLSSPQFIADATWLSQSIDYQRIDSGGVVQPNVSNQFKGLPIPSVGYATALSSTVTFAAGAWVPFGGLAKFPVDGPQRYSNVSLAKTLIGTIGVGLGWRVSDRLRLGVTLQNHIIALESEVVFSGCPSQIVCAPEDPEFDSYSRIDQNSWFNPSGSVGAQFDIVDNLTIGASVQLPVFVRGKGTIHTRLPASGFFNGTTLQGDRADASFDFPAAIKAGVEFRQARWRAELATTIDLWSQHKTLTIEPKDVAIINAPGVGTYQLSKLVLARNFNNTVAIHLGVESQPMKATPITVRAGYLYETSAVSDAYLTTLTVDGNKHLFALGGAYQRGSWSIDLVASLARMADREVTSAQARSPQLNPIRDTRDDPLQVFVNAGKYASSWLMLGAGVSVKL